MALHLDIKIVVLQEDNGAVGRIFDATGVYDGSNFPDGFGATGNPNKNEVDQVEIEISKGDLSETVVLTGSDITDFLDPTIGYNLNSVTLFGSAYERFEDGVYIFTVTYSGNTIQGASEDWEDYEEFYEAFLWNLWGKIRPMVTNIDVPITELIEPLSAAVANMLFDSVLYNCQFGDKDAAEKVFDFLTWVVDNNTSLTEIFKNIKSYD